MANQVTISTFLELRDNLSPGLMRVHTSLNRFSGTLGTLNANLKKMANAANQLGSAFSKLGSPTQIANIRRLINALNTAVVSPRLHLSIVNLAKALHQAANNAHRLLLLINQIRNAGPIPPLPGPRPGGGPGSPTGFMGQLIGSNLIAAGITRAVGFVVEKTVGFIKKAIDVNAEYEKSISAISAAMYTMDISPSMEVAEAYSKSVVETLRKYAAILPGEAADYVEVFQRTIPSAIQSGMKDAKQYAEFVSKYTAVAIQRGVGAKIAASNLQIMLNGTARAGTKMAQVLSAYTGKTMADINKLSREARFDLYQKAVEDASAGMSAAAGKSEAIFGELKTNIEDIYRIGGQPLFEAAKNSAKELNEWFKENQKSVMALSNSIAQTLGDTLSGSITLAKILTSTLFDKGKGEDQSKEEQLKEAKGASALGKFMKGHPVLSAALKPSFGSALQALDLALSVPQMGKINRLTAQIKEVDEERARLEKAAAFYAPREEKLGFKFTPGNVSQMAYSISALRAMGMFQYAGKAEKDAMSDYIQSRLYKEIPDAEARKLKTQEIFQELIKQGAYTPRDLSTISEEQLRGAPKTRPEQTFDFRHSRFDIKQEFAEGFDPDRIAVAFASDLGRLGDMKLQASYGLAGGVR